MTERIIDNWLTSTNERGYQIPFCQLLVSKGYTILYISSHGVLERGKDIFALDPDGNPEAFQLKNGDIAVGTWRDIQGEIEELIKLPFRHPDLPVVANHKSVLITSGRINDTVTLRIEDRNASNWGESADRKLTYKDREYLLAEFVRFYGDFFPDEPHDVRAFLELYLGDGKDMLPREQLATFVEQFLHRDGTPAPATVGRARIAAVVIMTAYCLSPWTREGNRAAEIEGWTIVAANILAFAESHNLDPKYWRASYDLCASATETACASLLAEVRMRSDLLEGDALSDPVAYGARATIVLGYLCAYALWRSLRKSPLDAADEGVIVSACERFESDMRVYGESYLPYVVAYHWFCRAHGRTDRSVPKLETLLLGLINPDPDDTLPDPYASLEQAIRISTGMERDESHSSSGSYALRSFVGILAREGRRDALARSWKTISLTQGYEFFPEKPEQLLRWKSREGTLTARLFEQRQSWSSLIADARKADTVNIPQSLAQRPEATLLFLLVYPHRLRSDIVAWLESQIDASAKVAGA